MLMKPFFYVMVLLCVQNLIHIAWQEQGTEYFVVQNYSATIADSLSCYQTIGVIAMDAEWMHVFMVKQCLFVHISFHHHSCYNPPY